jgi:hypothetical protein
VADRHPSILGALADEDKRNAGAKVDVRLRIRDNRLVEALAFARPDRAERAAVGVVLRHLREIGARTTASTA